MLTRTPTPKSHPQQSDGPSLGLLTSIGANMLQAMSGANMLRNQKRATLELSCSSHDMKARYGMRYQEPLCICHAPQGAIKNCVHKWRQLPSPPVTSCASCGYCAWIPRGVSLRTPGSAATTPPTPLDRHDIEATLQSSCPEWRFLEE